MLAGCVCDCGPISRCQVHSIGMMPGSGPFGSEVMSSQIDQLTPNLGGGKSEELTSGIGANRRERLVQAEQCILKNVPRLFPPSQTGVVPQHRSREIFQAVAGVTNDFAPHPIKISLIRRMKPIDPGL